MSLLSFQPIAKTIYDAQVAFNVMDRYGEVIAQPLAETRKDIARNIANYLEAAPPIPAIQLVQAPVFHSHGFTGFVELQSRRSPIKLRFSCAAGFLFPDAGEPAPSLFLRRAHRGHCWATWSAIQITGGYWFWGVADNLRLPRKMRWRSPSACLDAEDE